MTSPAFGVPGAFVTDPDDEEELDPDELPEEVEPELEEALVLELEGLPEVEEALELVPAPPAPAAVLDADAVPPLPVCVPDAPVPAVVAPPAPLAPPLEASPAPQPARSAMEKERPNVRMRECVDLYILSSSGVRAIAKEIAAAHPATTKTWCGDG